MQAPFHPYHSYFASSLFRAHIPTWVKDVYRNHPYSEQKEDVWVRTRSRIMVMMYRVIDGAWKCQCHTSLVIGLDWLSVFHQSRWNPKSPKEHWHGVAEDTTSRQVNTISFDSGDVVEMVMNSLLCHGLIIEPNVLKLRKKILPPCLKHRMLGGAWADEAKCGVGPEPAFLGLVGTNYDVFSGAWTTFPPPLSRTPSLDDFDRHHQA